MRSWEPYISHLQHDFNVEGRERCLTCVMFIGFHVQILLRRPADGGFKVLREFCRASARVLPCNKHDRSLRRFPFVTGGFLTLRHLRSQSCKVVPVYSMRAYGGVKV